MPEESHAGLAEPDPTAISTSGSVPAVRCVELHCKTNFSFLEGASHPEELVDQAARLGYAGLAITDRNSVAGVVRAHVAAGKIGLKLIIGAEVTMVDAGPILLWAMDREGYGQLCRLLTRGRRLAPKGECRLAFADVAEYSRGLLAGVLPPSADEPSSDLPRWRDVFRDRTYAVAQLHRGPLDERRLDLWNRAARAARVPLIAAGDVHYHDANRRFLQDVLTAIRLGTTVTELGTARFPNAERRLRSLDEVASLFAACPDAVSRTAEVADRCTFSLDELRYDYPEELCPAGETPSSYLARLTAAGRGTLSRRRPGQGRAAHRARAEDHRGTQLPGLFPDGLGPRALRPVEGHPLPGTRFGGELGRVLLPGRHLRRPGPDRRPVRAVHVERAGRSPRHRYRFRTSAPGRGDPVRLREVRPGPGRHDGRTDHVSAALRRAGRRQGTRPGTGPGRTRWPGRSGITPRPTTCSSASARRASTRPAVSAGS